MQNWDKLTSAQWWAAGRHYITFAIGVLGGIGFISLTQQNDAVNAINSISDGVGKIATGVGTLMMVFGPIINGWIAAKKASPMGQIQSVAEIAKDPSSPVQAVITTATPEGQKLAEAIPGPVVPAGSLAAKQLVN